MPFLPFYTVFDPADKKTLTQKDIDAGYCECPRCNGHGLFIMEENAYGKGRHFKGVCANCNDLGKVKKDSLNFTCQHDYSIQETIGRCLHKVTCKHCGQSMTVDSGD